MQPLIKAARGTQDALPGDVYKLQYLEECARQTAKLYGFREIRTPVFEHTELFQRSVGDTTDVVQKEMYTFEDKGKRSITLRPEGTAGAVRAFLEHGLYNEPLPQKMYYFTSCYRYEKPQAGRLREFHQFGVECFGAADAAADAEVISLANSLFKELGIKNLRLEINSIGCPDCRREYNRALREYFEGKREELCETCLGRLERNPMRILDCKSPVCSGIASNAPTVLDFLCGDCRRHFEKLQNMLKTMGISYSINPRIVRGLDYYTKTVFEFVSDEIGAQGTVCGGGRYDGLMDELGGMHVPSLGFAAGIERIILLMEAQGLFPEKEGECELFLVAAGERALEKAVTLAAELRENGVCAQYDLAGRSVKAQMKYANKLNAAYTVVIGDNELEKDSAMLKNMSTGDSAEIAVGNFTKAFLSRRLNAVLGGIASNLDDPSQTQFFNILEGKR